MENSIWLYYFKNIDKNHIMYSKSDNIDIMIYDKAGEVIKDIFELIISRYQIGLETLMKCTDFIFDWGQLWP